MSDRPIYIPNLFTVCQDRYSGDQWRDIWDGFELEEPSGFICCSECGGELHCYMASRDDPGYNELVGTTYVMYDTQIAICSRCLYEAFDSFAEIVDRLP